MRLMQPLLDIDLTGVVWETGSVRTCRQDALSLLLKLAGIEEKDKGGEEAQAYANQLETTIQGV